MTLPAQLPAVPPPRQTPRRSRSAAERGRTQRRIQATTRRGTVLRETKTQSFNKTFNETFSKTLNVVASARGRSRRTARGATLATPASRPRGRGEILTLMRERQQHERDTRTLVSVPHRTPLLRSRAQQVQLRHRRRLGEWYRMSLLPRGTASRWTTSFPRASPPSPRAKKAKKVTEEGSKAQQTRTGLGLGLDLGTGTAPARVLPFLCRDNGPATTPPSRRSQWRVAAMVCPAAALLASRRGPPSSARRHRQP